MRVVSLLPSATEIVCALGAGGELVGISHECDHPPEVVTGLPALTASRISMDGAQRVPRPRVVSIEWLDPVMLGGTWMPELITTAGGDPLEVTAGKRARRWTWPALPAWSLRWW
jgi:hypothetical protein